MTTVKVHANYQTARWVEPWTSRDYWLTHCLGEALKKEGGDLVYGDADIECYLWGWIERPVNGNLKNVLWIVGHPDMFLAAYNKDRTAFQGAFVKVFCSSKRFCYRLKKEFGIDAEWLVCPAPNRPPCAYDPVRELAFVGNADPRKNRPALAPVLDSHDSLVYGGGWQALLKNGSFRATYTKFVNLPYIWNSARIVPYSHHEDMRREGFVADAALDVCVNSGALLLSDHNEGWYDLGLSDEDMCTWTTSEKLKEEVKWLLVDEPDRERTALAMKKVASKFTYSHVAQTLLSI